MSELKRIVYEIERFGRCNESDFPLIVETLKSTLEDVAEVESPIEEKPETNAEKAARLTSKIISIDATLESIKPLYTELDKAILELKELIHIGNPYTEEKTHISVTIVDQFEEKNTIWRIQSTQRFIAKIENLDERFRREAKEAKALAKKNKE